MEDILGYSSHDWRKNTDDAVVIWLECYGKTFALRATAWRCKGEKLHNPRPIYVLPEPCSAKISGVAPIRR